MSASKSKRQAFSTKYGAVFSCLGRPLKKRDACLEQKIKAAEKKLGINTPAALREYYLVAGQERTLNHAHNQLLTPAKWYLHKGKLCFLEENQGAVVWGVSLGGVAALDPAVYQSPTSDDEPTQWYLENRKCSAFLSGMLHWQASFGGGLPHTKSAACSKDTISLLEKN